MRSSWRPWHPILVLLILAGMMSPLGGALTSGAGHICGCGMPVDGCWCPRTPEHGAQKPCHAGVRAACGLRRSQPSPSMTPTGRIWPGELLPAEDLLPVPEPGRAWSQAELRLPAAPSPYPPTPPPRLVQVA